MERRMEWEVIPPGMWENDDGPTKWWAVANNEGIKAYFGEEDDALMFAAAKNSGQEWGGI